MHHVIFRTLPEPPPFLKATFGEECGPDSGNLSFVEISVAFDVLYLNSTIGHNGGTRLAQWHKVGLLVARFLARRMDGRVIPGTEYRLGMPG